MKMPKRPKQHQVEDLSVVAFRKTLPRQWIYREKDKDYGIDGEVEIFDENDVEIPIFDTTKLHSESAVKYALEK